ncbi:MAG TPA: ATP-binding protein [Thermoanaerobaculia bacterium]|jgi:two-component system sensor histidine kinase KdpD|nr:ATP-binding protein [Thermoanaerobaculia bacterium]
MDLRRLRPLRAWLLWSLMLTAVTLTLIVARDDIDPTHAVLIYLLVVLGGSASGGGRPLGFGLACVSFLCIDYFVQQPYDTLSVSKPLDWLELLAFLVTAAVATELLGRANAEAAAARRHAEEIDRLSSERTRLIAEAEHAAALREADRMKDALLAAVSHDLRTPLTTIKALAHDIAGEGDERAEIIEGQADRLNHMVADLLDLSRLNAGGLRVEPEINAAEDLVGAAAQQAAGILGGRELRTAVELSQPVQLGRFDFVHALRALVNLIENAAKYSPAGSPIDISVGGDGEWLSVQVADRGPGIAAAETDRIFEPFYRSPRVAGHTSGAGLGLAIARRLTEAQGGRLTHAERPGGGSVFTLQLPAAVFSDGGLEEEA